MSSWLCRTTLPRLNSVLEKNPNCIVFVMLDCGVWPPLPIAQMGLLRLPGEGGAAGSHESERELGSRPALPAVAESNSLHFLLTLVSWEAWASGRRALLRGPLLCLQASCTPCCLTEPTEPTPRAG